MIVVLLGAPGSGKGTQSKRLAGKYGFQHLATGDLFRAEMAEGTPLGLKAQGYVNAGRLVPDGVVTEMVAARLKPGARFLLDGFPRNIDQARALGRLLAASGSAVDLVCSLVLPKAEAVRRMTSRRVCASCGEVYNVLSRPPKAEGVCNRCGGKVVQRADDAEATAVKRLSVFEDLTAPLAVYYKAEGVFHEIDAARSPDEVEAALSAVLSSARGGRRPC